MQNYLNYVVIQKENNTFAIGGFIVINHAIVQYIVHLFVLFKMHFSWKHSMFINIKHNIDLNTILNRPICRPTLPLCKNQAWIGILDGLESYLKSHGQFNSEQYCIIN